MNPREPWPLALTYLKGEKSLRIEYDDGAVFHLPAEYLRVESPSAEVQGHGSASKLLVAGKRSVSIRAMEPVGQYAVRITFDDGHDTGLFSWRYLHQLGREQETRWHDYETRLRAAGLQRGA